MKKVSEVTSLIEYLRHKMISVAEECGSLVDDQVISMSQRLDGYLMMEQQKEQELQTLPLTACQGQTSRPVREIHASPVPYISRTGVLSN